MFWIRLCFSSLASDRSWFLFICGMFVLGTGSYWAWSEDTTCARAWWTCHEMCARSKWKSCGTKMHRMHPDGQSSVYYFFFSRSSSHSFYSSIWLSCYSGIHSFWYRNFSHISSSRCYYLSSDLPLLESFGALFRWATDSMYSGWNPWIGMYSCWRSVWQLCDSGWPSSTRILLVSP